MARIRTIKPDFWTDGTMIGLSPWARLFYIGTWNFALCDHGHLPDDALGLKLKILPADDVDSDALLDELMTKQRIVRITLPDGRTFLHIVRLNEHQKTDPRWKSRCPVCSALTETRASSDEFRGDSTRLAETRAGGEGIGEERKGGEGNASGATPPVDNSDNDAEPPVRCPKHLNDPTPPPCGFCKDTRHVHEVWARPTGRHPGAAPRSPVGSRHALRARPTPRLLRRLRAGIPPRSRGHPRPVRSSRMSVELIYRTDSVAALAWRRDYHDRWTAAKVHWDAFEHEIEAAYGTPEGQPHRQLYMVRGRIVGIVATSYEQTRAFPGWKDDRRYPCLSPKLNTKAGKEWQAKLEALPVLDLRTEARAIGVPDYVLIDHSLYSAGIDDDHDETGNVTAIYQVWGSGRCEEEVRRVQAQHPEVEWVEVPRSQWYAREEAREKADV